MHEHVYVYEKINHTFKRASNNELPVLIQATSYAGCHDCNTISEYKYQKTMS